MSDSARVTTSSTTGQTGSWLIDPADFTVAASGGDMTGAAVSTALASNNVTIQSGNGASGTAGNVNISDSVSWSANTLTLNASSNININAALNGSGTAGLALQYGQGAVAAGNTSTYNVSAPVNLAATGSFSTKLGSDGVVKNYTILTSLGASGSTTGSDLQGINGSLAGNYVLGANIDASSTSTWNSGAGFAPLGTSSANFTGNFDGLGHTISGLTIKRPSTNDVGLFGYAGAGCVIRNIGLLGGSISGQNFVGGLLGDSLRYVNISISNSYTTGSVSGSADVGGLAGRIQGSTSNSYATGSVSGSYNVGGLVGATQFGSISNSYATGSVSGGGDNFGGLVGDNYLGSISNSYATGSVSGRNFVGGLLGYNYQVGSGSSISNNYATGRVSGNNDVGGLLGYNDGGNISNSYWNTATTGQASSAGGTGLSDADWHTAAKFVGFNFTTTPGASGNNWVMVDGGSPLLASEYSTTIVNAHQLQLISLALGARYTLGANIDASATSSGKDVWGSAGFAPLGTDTSSFSGSFDGQGHTVSGLTINRGTTNYVGLFGSADTGSAIRNIGLLGGRISGNVFVGALVGISDGSISNSYATGSVSGDSAVGGLVGYSKGSIGNSYATGSVTGASNVGGLAGANQGTVSNSYATGSVSGDSAVGGLVGYSKGSISTSYATGRVQGTGSNIGGLLGVYDGGSISSSYWNKATTGQELSAGGTGLSDADWHNPAKFAGFNFTTTPGASGNNWFMVDGGSPLLASEYSTTIVNAHQLQLISLALGASYTLGADIDASATGTAGKDVWGSAGFAPLGTDASRFTGSFDGMGHTVSGLTINRSTTDNVGLFGYAGTGSAILNVGLLGSSISGAKTVGGLVGGNRGSVSHSYATGSVSGSLSVGGLVGHNYTGTISNAYATGSVSGSVSSDGYVGGLVGFNDTGTVSNVYATGSVSGSNAVGGLIGVNLGHDQQRLRYRQRLRHQLCWRVWSEPTTEASAPANAAGSVSGTQYVGGLSGGTTVASSTVTSSYWDFTSSGQSSSSGGTGLSSDAMKPSANFVGWDTSVWKFYDGFTAPLLKAFLTPLTVTLVSGTRVYDGTTTGLGVSYSSTPNANLLGTPTSVASSKNVGVQALETSGLYSNQQGYDISYVSGTLSISKANATVTANSGSGTYTGQTQSVSGFTATGLVAGETAAVLTGVTAGGSGKNAGSYTTTARGTDSNYTLSFVNGTLAISKANATVTANSGSGTYNGQTQSVSGFTATGLVAGETAAVLTGVTAGGSGKNAGSYTTTASGTDGNYKLSFVNGSLAISKADATVTANSGSGTYTGQTQSVSGFTATGLVAGETAAVLTGVHRWRVRQERRQLHHHGPRHRQQLHAELRRWLARHRQG